MAKVLAPEEDPRKQLVMLFLRVHNFLEIFV